MSLAFFVCFSLIGCSTVQAWDKLGGDESSESTITEEDTTSLETDMKSAITTVSNGITEEQNETSCTTYTGENVYTISTAGDYLLSGDIASVIKITVSGVHLFLDNANITKVGKKVIEGTDTTGVCDLIITLIGTNNISNSGTGAEEKNAIDCTGDVTINGSGSLTISSAKSGIKCDGTFFGIGGTMTIGASSHGVSADSIYLSGSTIDVTSSGKDGLHAESSDDVTTYDYSKGFIYADRATSVTIANCYGDGLQADTFVYIKAGTFDISTLPTWTTATSSDGCYSLSGSTYTRVSSDSASNYSNYYQLAESSKAIKVGEIDYGDLDTIVSSSNYTILIEGGTFTTDTTDDAIHTNSGNVLIYGGTFSISTSDDGLHADNNLTVGGGNITISKSYEGFEGKTIEISGGTSIISSTDDGINAANSDLSTTQQKAVCHILISGGTTYVNAYGDGVDSNGGILISGGTIFISGPTNSANGALDSENGIQVTGGTLIAIGSSGMVETPATNSTQYCISMNLSSSKTGNVVVKYNNETIISFSPSTIFGVSKNYASVVISSPLFALESTYAVTTGTTSTSIKISSIITKSGSAVGPTR